MAAHMINLSGDKPMQEADLLLHLITEDLKSRFFFNSLDELDFCSDYYHSDLGSLILRLMGFNPEDDDHLDMYNRLATRYSDGLFRDRELLRHNAKLFYSILVNERS